MLSLEELGKSKSSIAVEEGKNIDYFDDYERIIDYVAHTRESRK